MASFFQRTSSTLAGTVSRPFSNSRAESSSEFASKSSAVGSASLSEALLKANGLALQVNAIETGKASCGQDNTPSGLVRATSATQASTSTTSVNQNSESSSKAAKLPFLHGSMVALITPLKEDESVDFDALTRLLEWHIESGTHGIVVMGTTGESATFGIDEHLEVVRFVVDAVAGRVSVIAGTGANSTSEALVLTAGAKDAGADACLLVTPYYNKPTQEGLFLHHKRIAECVAIPQLLYNVPGRTGVDLLPETVLRLSKIDNIVGIKEATGDVSRMRDIKRSVSKEFILLSGDDDTALEFMKCGGVGEISVTANVCPKDVAEMCVAAHEGDMSRAKSINDRIASLHKSLFCESNPIPVKWAMHQLGFCTDVIRLPLTVLSEDKHDRVLRSMCIAGVIAQTKAS